MFDSISILMSGARADDTVSFSTAPEIAAIIMNVMIYASFTAAIISFAYAAIMIATSRGDGAIKQAAMGRSALVGSLIAGILGLSSVAIKLAIVSALGVTGGIANDVPTI